MKKQDVQLDLFTELEQTLALDEQLHDVFAALNRCFRDFEPGSDAKLAKIRELSAKRDELIARIDAEGEHVRGITYKRSKS